MASPFKTGLPVSAGRLPPHRVALLNAIAGGESGGRYNVRYTPKGGAEFKGFDRHPGIFEPGPHGKSSAAGRYQFTKTTWDDLGGGAFTPERQDEMAWRLAERDYRKRTNRNLDRDVQAKGLTPEIMEALSPTWKALESNRPRHQATYQQTLGEILGGEAPQSMMGSAGDDTLEDSMATGGPQSLFNIPTVKKPENRSQLLAMVLANMQRDADRPNPRSGIEAGARALTQGLQGYFAGDMMRKNEADEAQKREMLAGLLEGNPEAAQLLQSGIGDMGSWENAILQQAFREPEKPSEFSLSPGQARFRGDEKIAELPAKPDKPTVQEFYTDDGQRIKRQWDPETGDWEDIGGPKADTPLVQIDQRGETKFHEELGKLDAKRVDEISTASATAHNKLNEIERMKAALESGRFTPGAFGDTRQYLSQIAELAGVNPEEIGLGLGDPATADTLDAASKKLAAEAAKDLSRITNMSLGFIRDSLPSLTRTPEGNAILTEVMERAALREIELGELANEYVNTYGTLRPKDAPTFFEARNELEKRDPVISDELKDRIRRGSQAAPKSWKDVLGGSTSAPPEAVEMLRQDPSPQARREFDEVFGAGAAKRILGGK